MKLISAKSRLLIAPLTGLALLFGNILSAADETPPKPADTFTSYAWSFPRAKAPMHFVDDGTVVDADGAAKFWWKKDPATGAVHLMEKSPKGKKGGAHFDLWFWDNLKGFAWNDPYGSASGQGYRVEEAAPAPQAAASVPPNPAPAPQAVAAVPPKPVPLPPPLPTFSPQLQAFSTTWLEKLISPLDGSPLPRAQLAPLQMDCQARLALATPEEKPTLQAALQVCTAFSNLMDAREKARTSLTAAEATTTQSVGSTKSTKHIPKWAVTSQLNEDQKRAHIRAAQHDSSFVASGAASSVKTQWEQQKKPWRDSIQQLLIRERQAELAQLAAQQASASVAAPR